MEWIPLGTYIRRFKKFNNPYFCLLNANQCKISA